MHKTCDVLILTASFGNGHKSVSGAIKGYLQDKDMHIRVEIVDMYQIIRPYLHTWMYKGFHMLVKYATPIYNYDYYKKNNSEGYNKLHTCKSSLRRLADYIQAMQPSLIISTFPTCTSYVMAYKEQYQDTIPLVTCITDVVKGNEWVHTGEESYYLVPTHEVRESLISKGIEEDHVITTGIPIRPGFLVSRDRVQLRRTHGIHKDQKAILMMGGGLGLIPDTDAFYSWVKSQPSMVLYIITGHNQELYRKMRPYNDGDNIRVLGYTDEIADLMTMADVVITKPGGITLFESLARLLPLIIYKPVLGQEVENSKYIVGKGLGRVVDNEGQLIETLDAWMRDKQMTEELLGRVAIERQQIDMDQMVSFLLGLYSQSDRDKDEHDVNS